MTGLWIRSHPWNLNILILVSVPGAAMRGPPAHPAASPSLGQGLGSLPAVDLETTGVHEQVASMLKSYGCSAAHPGKQPCVQASTNAAIALPLPST